MFAICWILEFQIVSSSSAGLHLSEFCVAHADSADLKGQVLRLIFQPLLALMKLGPSLPQLPTQRSPGEVSVLTLNPRWGPGPNVFPFWVCRETGMLPVAWANAFTDAVVSESVLVWGRRCHTQHPASYMSGCPKVSCGQWTPSARDFPLGCERQTVPSTQHLQVLIEEAFQVICSRLQELETHCKLNTE